MQQIDWSKAPDDATHAGYVAFDDGRQCGNRLTWYKSVTSSGYRYWKKGESIRWQSAAGNPLCKTLFLRPTSLPEIDWSEAPDDATHGGQDQHWFSFYKDITPSGCKFWHIGKNDRYMSGAGWKSTLDQPNADPLFVRPTVPGNTRDEALSWCVENLEVWPGVISIGKNAPCGWEWGLISNIAMLRCLDGARCMVIQKSDWEVAVLAPDNPPLTAGPWACEKQSLFTDTTNGRLTYKGDKVCELPSTGGAPLNEAFAAIDTLKLLDYTYNGGQLWEPPIGKERDGWNIGDKCWISNKTGRNINGNSVGLLGFNKTSTVISLFTSPKGSKMAVVHHGGGFSAMWDLDMLNHPLNKRDKVVEIITEVTKHGLGDANFRNAADEIIELLARGEFDG